MKLSFAFIFRTFKILISYIMKFNTSNSDKQNGVSPFRNILRLIFIFNILTVKAKKTMLAIINRSFRDYYEKKLLE